ncbi:MAG TPA: HAD family phosphatase [Candidatus Nanoarchaeia archaeon]|nr:HAD family phosphatase [Candidatus Nanoarchaeia archaeon]
MQKKEVKAVLFDMDGVLVDSVDAWFHVFNDTLSKFGREKLSRKNFENGFGSPIQRDMKVHFKGRTIDEVIKSYNQSFVKRKKLVKLFPHSLPVLREMKRKKIKTALITNSSRGIAFAILNHFKLRKYFNAVVTIQDVKNGKPAPDMPLLACRKLKVSPRQSIQVGDTQNDMVAGKKAKCITVGYKTKGDFTIRKMEEILEIIK